MRPSALDKKSFSIDKLSNLGMKIFDAWPLIRFFEFLLIFLCMLQNLLLPVRNLVWDALVTLGNLTIVDNTLCGAHSRRLSPDPLA